MPREQPGGLPRAKAINEDASIVCNDKGLGTIETFECLATIRGLTVPRVAPQVR